MKNVLLFIVSIVTSVSLSAQEGASSGSAANGHVCVTCDFASLNKNYKRTHLILGSLESTNSTTTVKSGTTSTDVETSNVELSASYYYNFGKFALGGRLLNTTEKTETATQSEETKTSQVNFGGRFFFVDNIATNNLVPYVGLELMGLSSENNDTPKLELSMGGSQILLGLDVYVNHMAFFNFEFGFGSATGDAKQGTTTLDTEVKGAGLTVGIGIALE